METTCKYLSRIFRGMTESSYFIKVGEIRVITYPRRKYLVIVVNYYVPSLDKHQDCLAT